MEIVKLLHEVTSDMMETAWDHVVELCIRTIAKGLWPKVCIGKAI